MPGSAPALPIDEARLVARAQRFVRVPSPQTAAFEADPQVQAFIGEAVAPLLDELAIPWRRDRMGNLIAECGAGNGPTVMLMAYAMTHPASRMRDPFAGELLGDGAERAIRGRGVAEQKASLAAALAALAAVRDAALPGRVILAVSTAGETGTHDAATAILEALDRVPDLAVVAIGTRGRASLANKGRIDVEITVRGAACHSSTPWRGVDAVAGARAVLGRLDRIDLSGRSHPQLGPATLVCTAIRSFPEATHTIQDEARLTLDRRLLPGDDPAAAFAEIEAALAGLAPWAVEARLTRLQLPAETPADHPLMRAVVAGQRAAGAAEPAFFHSHGCVDAGFLQARGCPATMWGPGDPDLWHADDERVLVADLVTGAEAYAGFLAAALTGDTTRPDH